MATTLEQLRSTYPHLSDDAIADLAGLALKLGNNQKTRKGLLGLVKEADPNTPIPEIDESNAFNSELAKRDELIAKIQKERDEEKFAAALASQKNDARSKFGLSEDDMSRMEEMMKKGELPADYRFAPQLYKQQTESATPTNYGTGGYGPLDIKHAAQGKEFEGLMDDPDNWSLRTAHSLIDDIQKKGRASAF
jgi:hypothetical protein